MIKFKYCGTHIEDEKYMNEMSSLGWNTKSLIEGFWKFEKGKPNEYIYRIYYFRGLNNKEIHNKIEELKKEDIEFVHKYSFWGIFRAKKDFELYKEEEQLSLCNKIRKPMIIATIVCPLVIAICIILSIIISRIFIPITCLMVVYYSVCLYLMIEYTKLINLIKRRKKIMIKIEFREKEKKSIAYDYDKKVGECDFEEINDTWNITHTEVDSAYQGHGIAKKLVENVIQNAKALNKKLEATCSYAKKLI